MSEPRKLTMPCRRCGAILHGDPALKLGRRASRYDELVFRCDACGIGYSNAMTEGARVEITATPAGNVPPEVRGGLDEALAGGANVDAREGQGVEVPIGVLRGRRHLDGDAGA